MEGLSLLRPKGVRVLQALFMQFLVLLHGVNVSIVAE